MLPRRSMTRQCSNVTPQVSRINVPSAHQGRLTSSPLPTRTRTQSAWHSSFTCEQYQSLPEEARQTSADLALVEAAVAQGWKRCPECRCGSTFAGRLECGTLGFPGADFELPHAPLCSPPASCGKCRMESLCILNSVNVRLQLAGGAWAPLVALCLRHSHMHTFEQCASLQIRPQVLCVPQHWLQPHHLPLRPQILLRVRRGVEGLQLRALERGPSSERGAATRQGAGRFISGLAFGHWQLGKRSISGISGRRPISRLADGH
jgi:hypothetical protein